MTIRIGFGVQVAKTSTYPVVCRFPLLLHCDHNLTLQTDGRHARSISVTCEYRVKLGDTCWSLWSPQGTTIILTPRLLNVTTYPNDLNRYSSVRQEIDILAKKTNSVQSFAVRTQKRKVWFNFDFPRYGYYVGTHTHMHTTSSSVRMNDIMVIVVLWRFAEVQLRQGKLTSNRRLTQRRRHDNATHQPEAVLEKTVTYIKPTLKVDRAWRNRVRETMRSVMTSHTDAWRHVASQPYVKRAVCHVTSPADRDESIETKTKPPIKFETSFERKRKRSQENK